MNNLEYLNQISKTSRPVKNSGNNQGFGTIIKIAVIGVVAFIILFIVGAIISSKSNSASTLGPQIYIRTTNLEKTINTYNKSLPVILGSPEWSSNSKASSLSLTAATNQLDPFFKSSASKDKNLTQSETEYQANLDGTLTNAKLNGMLDRAYANQMQLQTSLLLSMLEQAINHTRDENLKNIYAQYQSNLTATNTDLVNYSSSD